MKSNYNLTIDIIFFTFVLCLELSKFYNTTILPYFDMQLPNVTAEQSENPGHLTHLLKEEIKRLTNYTTITIGNKT